MKVGLLTTYSFNYGSYFQAVSLQKKIQEMGHECELINEELKKYEWFNLFLLYMMDPILPIWLKKKIAYKIPQYNSYLKIRKDVSRIEVSPRHMHNWGRISERYDCIVVGSDELWSANKLSIRFVPEYFGYGCKCPVFSYATCAIKFDITNESLRQKAKKGLENFEVISVRDDVSKEKIEKIVPNKSVEKVLDPTLLNPFFSFKGIKEKNNNKFILLYGQHYSEAQISFIKNYAIENNCEIRCTGWRQKWCDVFIDTCSGEELQKAFAEAEFCFPSTFHGTIFSIVNHKQFVSMLNPLRGGKVELLLKDLNLQGRIYHEKLKVTDLENIDYESVNKILEKYRSESQKYLIQALERVMR